MFGKKKEINQERYNEKKADSKLPDDNKEELIKETEYRKEKRMQEGKMTSLTSDVDIKGTIKFGGAMRIDGKFKGELMADNGELVVGRTGNVKADIKVNSAVIEGRVDGNIKAFDKVELKQNAHLVGDLQAKTLIVEKGVTFVGKCDVNPEGGKIESQSHKKGKKEENNEEIKANRLVNV